jgi:GNAT superfamily N-acetyltransferase
MQYRLPTDKVYCECYGDKGFYFATKAKTHARLIEIAVRDEHKGQGIGKSLLYRLLSRMKADGIFKLTFRTPINESAQYFWLKQGAKIIDIKDNDYVMELIFK